MSDYISQVVDDLGGDEGAFDAAFFPPAAFDQTMLEEPEDEFTFER